MNPLLLFLGSWLLVEQVYNSLEKNALIKDARAYADSSGKPLLNYGCYNTSFGDVNADIYPRNVTNFALINPDFPLPFPDNFFGSTVCSHVLEHVEDPWQTLNELTRVSDRVYLLTPLPIFLGAWLTPSHKWVFLKNQAMRIREKTTFTYY